MASRDAGPGPLGRVLNLKAEVAAAGDAFVLPASVAFATQIVALHAGLRGRIDVPRNWAVFHALLLVQIVTSRTLRAVLQGGANCAADVAFQALVVRAIKPVLTRGDASAGLAGAQLQVVNRVRDRPAR